MPHKKVDVRKLIKLYNEGVNRSEVSRRLGVSEYIIGEELRRLRAAGKIAKRPDAPTTRTSDSICWDCARAGTTSCNQSSIKGRKCDYATGVTISCPLWMDDDLVHKNISKDPRILSCVEDLAAAILEVLFNGFYCEYERLATRPIVPEDWYSINLNLENMRRELYNISRSWLSDFVLPHQGPDVFMRQARLRYINHVKEIIEMDKLKNCPECVTCQEQSKRKVRIQGEETDFKPMDFYLCNDRYCIYYQGKDACTGSRLKSAESVARRKPPKTGGKKEVAKETTTTKKTTKKTADKASEKVSK